MKKDTVENSLELIGPLSGEGAISVLAGVKTGIITNFCLKVNGDASGFAGSIGVTSAIQSTGLTAGLQCTAGLIVTNTAMPAVVALGDHSYLGTFTAADQVTFATLSLGADVTLQVTTGDGVCSRFTATDAFSMSGKVKVAVKLVSSDIVGENPGVNYPFLTVPAASALSTDDFEVDLSMFPSFVNPRLAITEAEGMKTLSIVVDPYVRTDLETADGSTDVLSDHSSAFTNAWQWSDEREPHEGTHYLVDKKNLRTLFDLDGVMNFPGKSLTLANGASLVIAYLEYSIPLLRFVNGGYLYPKYNEGGVTLRAPIEILSGTAVFRPYAGGLFTVDGEISGSGDIQINGNANGSSNPGGYTELLGLNTNFCGRTTVTMGINPDRDFPSFETKAFSRLYVNDGRNVGGAMSPADPMGFTLENYSQLITRNSVTFDEPTRGIFVKWVGRFNVADADHVLAIRSPLAVHGTLYKEGPGTIAFANPQPTFGATATATVPDADATNRCVVVGEGNVILSSAFALNGLNVTVTNDAPVFALDIDATDADLAAYGLVDILTPDCPFVATEAATKLHFRLDTATDAKPAWSERTVAVCTVKADQASAVAALLDVKAVRGTGIRVAAIRQVPVTVNETSCVTFVADLVANQGMLLLVR